MDVDVKISVNPLGWKGVGEEREYEPPLMKAAWMLKGVRSKKETKVNKDVQEVKEVKKAKETVEVQTQQLHAARKFTLSANSANHPRNGARVIHANICLYLPIESN